MIDKDQIIKVQQEKIERIEQLQEELHKLSMFGLLTVNVLGLPDEDVLDGMSPREAIEKNMTENDEEDE